MSEIEGVEGVGGPRANKRPSMDDLMTQLLETLPPGDQNTLLNIQAGKASAYITVDVASMGGKKVSPLSSLSQNNLAAFLATQSPESLHDLNISQIDAETLDSTSDLQRLLQAILDAEAAEQNLAENEEEVEKEQQQQSKDKQIAAAALMQGQFDAAHPDLQQITKRVAGLTTGEAAARKATAQLQDIQEDMAQGFAEAQKELQEQAEIDAEKQDDLEREIKKQDQREAIVDGEVADDLEEAAVDKLDEGRKERGDSEEISIKNRTGEDTELGNLSGT